MARNKWLTASIVNAPAEVIKRVFDEAERRDPKHRRTWVALVDGANHQIDRIRFESRKRRVKVTIVVDLVHVLGYLWNAAGCLYPNADQAAAQWVHRQATRVLQGQARKVAGTIRRQAANARLDPSQRKPADEAATYLTNKAPYLDYPTALTQGWPIATGIVEGACRHLVKDRMDITGARWGLAGAEAILKLRAIIANGDFDEYWHFHLTQNDTTSTKPATTTTPSQPHDSSLLLPSEEPHPLPRKSRARIGSLTTPGWPATRPVAQLAKTASLATPRARPLAK